MDVYGRNEEGSEGNVSNRFNWERCILTNTGKLIKESGEESVRVLGVRRGGGRARW